MQADKMTKRDCGPCSTMDASAILDTEQIQMRIEKSLKGWKLGSNEQTRAFLFRKFTAKDFQAALECINSMGAIAERENHHPDFHLTNYRDLQVNIYTHKLGGVTENDLALAEMLDREVNVKYSPMWLRENSRGV